MRGSAHLHLYISLLPICGDAELNAMTKMAVDAYQESERAHTSLPGSLSNIVINFVGTYQYAG